MTDGVNLNNFFVFINVVKDTKFRYPEVELRDAVGEEMVSIAGFMGRFVGKLFVYLVDNQLPLVFSVELQILDRIDGIFNFAHDEVDPVNIVHDSQRIAAPESFYFRFSIAAADKLQSHVKGLAGIVPTDNAATTVKVGRDADVVDADKFHRIIDMVDKVFDRC